MFKVFIDGRAGTTGLRIEERLAGRDDVELLILPQELRKDAAARRSMICGSDVTFLCLPDDAAIEAVSLAEGCGAKIIDASTAHRTAPGWVYGFPELSDELRDGIKNGSRIAVPGCHASGFLALVFPLVAAGIMPRDFPASCFSLTGYSGGGKGMIAEYTASDRGGYAEFDPYDAPRQYGLSQSHKHLREMQGIAGLTRPPVFCPAVADYYSGMEVTVPVHAAQLKGCPTAGALTEVYREAYRDQPFITVDSDGHEDGFLSANTYSGRDSMQILVTGSDGRLCLTARFDNLGKGSSGAAVQCMNLALGLEQTLGLYL
ncbi:MAG: N-acetyl-gamma-glutamyl-phosphate reductase [Oscillospiraceae bacterium]|nr:N-acetyl-gamma-glutamyl-phosphate reductase [Oscillospiraceae bacterium]